MLCDSVVVVAVVRTRPRAIPLAMITMRKSTHEFPFVSHMSMALRLAGLWAARAPLKKFTQCIFVSETFIYSRLHFTGCQYSN